MLADDLAGIPMQERKLKVSSKGVLHQFIKDIQGDGETPMLMGYEISFDDELTENTFK
jgi:hypothetical protein